MSTPLRLQLGRISASIFENTGEKGRWFSTTIKRRLKKDGESK